MQTLKEKIRWTAVKISHKLSLIVATFIKQTPQEKDLKKNLRQRTAELIVKNPQTQFTGEWEQYVHDIRGQLLRSDPRFFLNWDGIRASMFHEPMLLELRALESAPRWKQLKSKLQESNSGRPRPYPWLMSSSGNLIHHAFLLQEFLDYYKISADNLHNIFEFGGGYGSMCRWLYTVGFEGRYAIYDIPEFNFLQEYFLKNWQSNLKISFSPENQALVTLLDQTEDLAVYFSKNQPDLFLATWSLSESPLAIRSKVLNILPDPKYVLITFRDVFSGIDNLKYFQTWKATKPGYEWQLKEFAHLPGNFRLYGRKKL